MSTMDTIEDLMDGNVDMSEEQTENSEQERAEKGNLKLNLSDVNLSSLPPLPLPRKNKQRERNGGITTVLLSIFFFVGATHGLALEAFGGFEHHSAVWWVFFILIYSQAGLALLGLFAMLIVDPGAIQRSQEACFPIPVQMTPALQDYFKHRGRGDLFIPPGENYLLAEDESGDTYCVRCLVWRRTKEGKHYHCSTCQRCVKHYDHHCGVFGRCIGGKLFSLKGNFKFFVVMCTLFVTAFWTSFVAIVWSISNIYGPNWVVPIACLVVLYLMVTWQALIRSCGRRR